MFNDAIGIAKEIDQEAVDQIEFMSVGAEHANIADPAERRRIAANTYSFVTAASERLSGRDFSWRAGVRALTALDLPFALASAARWADDGTVNLDTTLGALLPIALERNLIGSDLGASLALLIDDPEESLFRALANRASTVPATEKANVLEALAKDVRRNRGAVTLAR